MLITDLKAMLQGVFIGEYDNTRTVLFIIKNMVENLGFKCSIIVDLIDDSNYSIIYINDKKGNVLQVYDSYDSIMIDLKAA